MNHCFSCIEYDITKFPVSFHLPMTRLLSHFLIHLHKYDLNYNSQEFAIKDKPTIKEMIEPVLRTLVMVSQVNSIAVEATL